MYLKTALLRAFLYSFGSAAMFGFTAFLVSENKVRRFDQSVTGWVQGFENPRLTAAMRGLTWIGSPWMVVALSAGVTILLALVLKHRKELILFLAVIIGAGLLNQILKMLFHRARPSLHRLIEARGFSFPSGHSMEAAAFYGIVAFLLWRHLPGAASRVVLLALSACMILGIGVSRIYLGVHYPSDILGGYFASGCWLAASVWVYQRRQEQVVSQ